VISLGAAGFFAITVDLLQALASHKTGIIVADLEDYYPKFWLEQIDWWLQFDPLLKNNPLWYRVMAVVSPTIYLPFYLAAIYAFIFQKEWIRIPAIMWSTALILQLVIIFAEQFWGVYAAPHWEYIVYAYGGYFLVPILLLYRCLESSLLFPKYKTE